MKYNLRKNGFSLIEVMVSVAIISVGMLAVASLVKQSIQVSNISKGQLVSQELAQEGIELIRWIRDNNFIEAGYQGGSPGWLRNIEPGSYRMSFLMNYPEAITSIDEGQLQVISSGPYEGFFDHDSIYPDSNFYRKIDIEFIPGWGNKAIRVVSTVKWFEAGQESSYSVETILYDWY